MPTWNSILAIVTLIISVLGLVWTYFGAILDIKERLIALETKIELFWKPLQDFLTVSLHHPTTPSIDEKLERFDNLNLEELYRLRAEIMEDSTLEENKIGIRALYYTLLLARIDVKAYDIIRKIHKPGIISKLINGVLGRDDDVQ